MDDITQPIYPIEAADLLVESAEWTKNVNDGLLDFIKENEVGLVNTEILDYFSDAYQFDITLINDYYQEIDVASYDFLNQRENYIIVPVEYESHFDKSVANLPTFDDAQIYYVDKTFPTLMNYGGLSKINSNPVLYIIVDDYNDAIYGYPFSNWRKKSVVKQKLKHSKKKLSIQYIYGHSMVKRYGLLLITLVLSYGLLTYLLIRYNKNIDVYDYCSRSVDAPYIMAVLFLWCSST